MIQNQIYHIHPDISREFLPMGFLLSIMAVIQITMAFLGGYTLCSKGPFQGFGRAYCLHIQVK